MYFKKFKPEEDGEEEDDNNGDPEDVDGNSEEWNEEDDIPLATCSEFAKRKRIWHENGDFNPDNIPYVESCVTNDDITPQDYFMKYIDHQLITNVMYLPNTGRVIQTSAHEIQPFIVVSLMMGCIKNSNVLG